MNSNTPSALSPKLIWSGLTDVGRVRQNNEDAFLALNLDAQEARFLGKTGSATMNGEDFIFAVSDGMGGAKSGEYASKIAVQKIAELLPKSFRLAAAGLNRDFNQTLAQLFENIHSEMTQMGRSYNECEGMGATLSLCWFAPGVMHFAHVGDSRIYYVPNNGKMSQLTEDHTHVGRMLRKGMITAYEARTRPDRNILEQVLGGKCRKVEPQFGSVLYETGDRFALFSDGVTDSISDGRIERLISDPPPNLAAAEPAERLINDAKAESGHDNLTALLVEVA